MGFQIVLKILMWFCITWVMLAVISGLYVFFRSVGREWMRQRRLTIRKVRMPRFIIDSARTKEQERARFIAILREWNPRMSSEDYLGYLRKFESDYDAVMQRNWAADLETIKPEDFGGE